MVVLARAASWWQLLLLPVLLFGLAQFLGGDASLLAEDDNRHDDLTAVAATLHPLDDHTLWPHLRNRPIWTWWLS